MGRSQNDLRSLESKMKYLNRDMVRGPAAVPGMARVSLRAASSASLRAASYASLRAAPHLPQALSLQICGFSGVTVAMVRYASPSPRASLPPWLLLRYYYQCLYVYHLYTYIYIYLYMYAFFCIYVYVFSVFY